MPLRMKAERPTLTIPVEADPTTNLCWKLEQTDRLIAWEILQRAMKADYAPIDPADLADLIGSDKGVGHRIIQNIQQTLDAQL